MYRTVRVTPRLFQSLGSAGEARLARSLVAAAVGCRVVEVAAERAHGSLSTLPSRVRTRHPIAGLRVQGRWRRTLREPQLLLHQVAADPHDPIPAHDCVHRVRLTRE